MKNFSPRETSLIEAVLRRPGQAFLLEAETLLQTQALATLKAAWLCGNPEWPCGSCSACEDKPHPDWIRVGGDGERIRRMQVVGWPEDILVPPIEGRWKVFVVQQAERLGDEAASLLLKLLEEPPPHAVLVLVTDRPHDLLPTLKSRCRWLTFRMPDAETPGIPEQDLLPYCRGDWSSSNWPEALASVAQAIRQTLRGKVLLSELTRKDPGELIQLWSVVVESMQALDQNANRDLVRRRLEQAFGG